MVGLSVPALLIILGILLLLFGASRLPKLSRSIGESDTDFRMGLSEDPNKPNVNS